MTQDSKLYISLLENTGGLVVLSQMLAVMLFPHDFPYFGRFRLPKSEIGDILIENSAIMYDIIMLDWITLNTTRHLN